MPGSFTGGNRCHVMNYQNTMARCKVYGPPNLFVTFTCNTKWREIWDALQYEPGQKPCDLSDLIVRIFHMKYNKFIADIREDKTFDPVCAALYTVECQNCGQLHTPAGPQMSSLMLSRGAGANMHSTPQKSDAFTLFALPATSEARSKMTLPILNQKKQPQSDENLYMCL